ncbi:MAG: hypothetical protein H7315_07390 [Herminiimonas sp.]|nr:hypothetical protein [Herminiimonas sp.]
MINPMHDANIPTLTEIIPVIATNKEPQPETTGAALTADSRQPTPIGIEPAPAVMPEPPFVSPRQSKLDWERLENEISERVLAQMMNRIDFVLEQRIRDSLADVLQTAVSGLAEEIRQGLQETLEAVVSHAVGQEIIQLQKSKT